MPTSVARLDAAALRLIETLPRQHRLLHLRRAHPHVVNRLAAVWHDLRAFEHAMHALLVDHRGGRQGFPVAARHELVALREHRREQDARDDADAGADDGTRAAGAGEPPPGRPPRR